MKDVFLAALAMFSLGIVLLGVTSYYDGLATSYKEEATALTNELEARQKKIESLRLKLHTVQRELAYAQSEIDRSKEVVGNGNVNIGETGYAIVTAYTAYSESTGKSPGDKGFNVTSSGAKGGYGVCAADPRYWKFGTAILIDGLGACVILDTGGAIKGKWRFDYMFGGPRESALPLALAWGRRLVRVKVLSK